MALAKKLYKVFKQDLVNPSLETVVNYIRLKKTWAEIVEEGLKIWERMKIEVRHREKRKLQKARREERRKKEDALVQWAHKCVETFVTTGKTAEMPKDLAPEMMQNRAGVFVTLHKNGQLRGCIGTFLPVRENIALEIWHNAVAACSQDPRFSAVRPDELDEIEYSVDVLTTPQAVKDINALNPKVDGIIVQNGNRRGLLLPEIEGIDTLAQQVAIAKQKAGIAPEEPINLFSFQVKRHH